MMGWWCRDYFCFIGWRVVKRLGGAVGDIRDLKEGPEESPPEEQGTDV